MVFKSRRLSARAPPFEKIDEKTPEFLRSRIFMLALEERSGRAKKALHTLEAELAPRVDVTPSIAAERALLAQVGGDMLRQTEECARALDFYQMSLDYGMKSYRLYRSIGICHEHIGNDPQAEKALLRAIDLNPNDAISLNYLGYWWADEGRYLEQAITYIKKLYSCAKFRLLRRFAWLGILQARPV